MPLLQRHRRVGIGRFPTYPPLEKDGKPGIFLPLFFPYGRRNGWVLSCHPKGFICWQSRILQIGHRGLVLENLFAPIQQIIGQNPDFICLCQAWLVLLVSRKANSQRPLLIEGENKEFPEEINELFRKGWLTLCKWLAPGIQVRLTELNFWFDGVRNGDFDPGNSLAAQP